jgi:YHS domain-containing protein
LTLAFGEIKSYSGGKGKDVRVSLSKKRLRTKGDEIMYKDPVCGMNVTPASAAGKSEYKGQIYYFCSPGCKKSFNENPEKYLAKSDEQSMHHHH